MHHFRSIRPFRSFSVVLLSSGLLLATAPFGQVYAKKNQLIQDPLITAAYQQYVAGARSGQSASFAEDKIALARAISGRKQHAPHHAVKTALRQLRKRYRWGGSSPKRGFDCSGLTQYSYKAASIQLPRTAAQQYRHTKRVSLNEIQVGDLIFFHTRVSRKRVNHVGIYVGDGKFIHAPRGGKRVTVASLSRYWKKRMIGVGRV